MKSSILLCVAILAATFSSFATEIRTATEIVGQIEIQRPRYLLKTTSLKAAVFNMPFGESYLISEKDKMFLKTADVHSASRSGAPRAP